MLILLTDNFLYFLAFETMFLEILNPIRALPIIKQNTDFWKAIHDDHFERRQFNSILKLTNGRLKITHKYHETGRFYLITTC